MFETISFVEEKQWEIIGLEGTKSTLENGMEDEIPEYEEYNQLSNPTYLKKERKNDLFLSSTVDFFVFFVPATLIFVFLSNRIFYCLFNYSISSYLRPYSFLLILFELLIQNNIEFFTFLSFRATSLSGSLNFSIKMLCVLAIVMLFLVVIGMAGSYFIYYIQYGKLGKYFLVNLFRFPSSYALMLVMYGVRPFLKGAVHALLYEEW